jgi:hypothetical protein
LAVESSDAFDISLRLTLTNDMALAKVDCFAEGTKLNFHDVINYRNRHRTHAVWPELSLGNKDCTTDTTSRDWQFAPHPTLLHLKRHDFYLSFGVLQVPVGTFGMYFKASQYELKQWSINFGGNESGQSLSTGETWTLPTFRLAFSQHSDSYATYAHFGKMIQAASPIADSASAKQDWWRAPLYCTWMDQCYAADALPAQDLQNQGIECDMPNKRVLTEQLVRDVVQVIRENDLPFKTVLLDEGWHRSRGCWEPHPDRFPNMRELVDELHAQGLKVVVWWGWPDIEKAAEDHVPKSFLAGEGKRNSHGAVMYDYSNPLVQEQYLKPLFHKLFSSDKGCYDLDGIKTDFMADKIHADMPLTDPTWRGEENYLVRMHELFYGLLKTNKPDAIHIGCAGHYWLSPYIDINRTYDVHSSNVMEHENRAKMLLSTTLNTPVAYDFHNFLDHLEEYFDSANKHGCSVQVGNVLYSRQDPFSKPILADQSYWNRLVAKLNT